MYDDFEGHESGNTPYTGDVLNETWSTYSSGSNNYIRLNKLGKKLIEDNAGSVLKLMFLSKNDYDGSGVSEPTGKEFIRFVSSSSYMKLRYNTISLDNLEATIYLAYCPSN